VDSDVTTLLSVGAAGSSLRLTVRPRATFSVGDPWFDAEIEVEALPFAGTLQTVFTRADLHDWLDQLAGLTAGTGQAVLGGGRAAELVIEAQAQIGSRDAEAVALSICLTPSGDDPYPCLSFLIFDVATEWAQIDARTLP
jgi:hypothetical protein